MFGDTTVKSSNLPKYFNPPPLRIGDRVAEHIEEGRAEEFVGEFDGLLSFAADGVGLVQNGRNALLFW